MNIVIDANMKLFSDRMHISSSRLIQDYGLSSIDEIIEEETKQGNTHALDYAREYYNSPQKLIKLFELTNVENKFSIINDMDPVTRKQLLPLLESEDLVMGLYFFTQEKLLNMLMETDISELVRVALEAFPFEEIMSMYTEEDLAAFFMQKDLQRTDVLKQLGLLPKDIMQKFIEGVTGMPAEQTDIGDLLFQISEMPDDQYRKFMASIDPEVQRQLTYQLTVENPEYMMLFPNETYVVMLSKAMKPDMVKSMIELNHDTLVFMNAELPKQLMSIVAAQIDEVKFARFLQYGRMKFLERASMI